MWPCGCSDSSADDIAGIALPLDAGIDSSMRQIDVKMMTTLRIVAYALALIAIALAVPLTLAAGNRGLVVGMLAGTLAVTPYVVVRALEEVVNV